MKPYLLCITFFGVLNLATMFLGFNEFLLTSSSIISVIITVGLVAVGISLLPLTSGGSTARWLLSLILMVSLLFSVSFDIVTWHVQIGIGLCTNIMNLIPDGSNPTVPQFFLWICLLFVGILGVISAITSTASSD